MWFYIWIGAIIYFTLRFNRNMTRSDEKSISNTTYADEVTVDGKKKIIIRDRCPNCGNTKLHYKGARQTAVYEYKFAVCDKCGTSFRVQHKPSSSNGILAFILSFIFCSFMAVVIFVVVLIARVKFGLF